MHPTTMSPPRGNAFLDGAEGILREFLGPGRGLGSISELSLNRTVRDYCEKFVVLDDRGKPAAFIIVSPASHPQAVSDAAKRAGAVRGALGEPLGASVLTPYRVAVADGRTYAIFPYCRPLSGRRFVGGLQRRLLASKVLHWLEDVTIHSRKPVNAESLDRRIVLPLRAIEEDAQLDPTIRAAAATALDDVQAGRWRPWTIAAHNDLWWGNLVHGRPATTGTPEFFVIDWGQGEPEGTPVGDLVRLSMSLGLSPRRCRAWMDRHQSALECRPVDMLSYVAVAFGALSLNLGKWPAERFQHAARVCFRYASDTIDVRARRSARSR
jgi:hypothetical protein